MNRVRLFPLWLPEIVWAPASPKEILDQLTLGQPLVVGIQWPGGGQHVVVLHAWLGTAWQYVEVGDPARGDIRVPYETLKNGYQGNGQWIYTVYTAKNWTV